jgi:lipopolysaccharide export system permease protein
MIIKRYLVREISQSLLFTTVVLLFIFLANQVVKFLHLAADGKIAAHSVLILLGLQMPSLLIVLLPLGLFLGIVLALGRLYSDSEMVVLAACGFGTKRFLPIIGYFALAVFLVVGILSFWLDPKVCSYSDQILSSNPISLELSQPDRFHSIPKSNWVFYINSASEKTKKLQKVFAASKPASQVRDEQKPWGLVVAQSGYQKEDPETKDLFLVLNNGYRYAGVPGNKNFQVIKYDTYAIRMNQSGGEQDRKEDTVATSDLWKMRNDRILGTELHWRTAQPVSALILAFLALPLSQVRKKRGRFSQLLPAILIYIVYDNLQFLARTWLKKGVLSLAFGMWWVHLLMIGIFVVLFIGNQKGWFTHLKRAKK